MPSSEESPPYSGFPPLRTEENFLFIPVDSRGTSLWNFIQKMKTYLKCAPEQFIKIFLKRSSLWWRLGRNCQELLQHKESCCSGLCLVSVLWGKLLPWACRTGDFQTGWAPLMVWLIPSSVHSWESSRLEGVLEIFPSLLLEYQSLASGGKSHINNAAASVWPRAAGEEREPFWNTHTHLKCALSTSQWTGPLVALGNWNVRFFSPTCCLLLWHIIPLHINPPEDLETWRQGDTGQWTIYLAIAYFTICVKQSLGKKMLSHFQKCNGYMTV